MNMSAYFHHPAETDQPIVKRASHDEVLSNGYTVIQFGDLTCFPTLEQIRQLHEQAEAYLAQYGEVVNAIR